MDRTKIFVENTKKIIQRKGYKQKYVAQKMNISDSKLSDILNYRKKIDVEIVSMLCDALDVKPNVLFGCDD